MPSWAGKLRDKLRPLPLQSQIVVALYIFGVVMGVPVLIVLGLVNKSTRLGVIFLSLLVIPVLASKPWR
jgi:Zn-dependent membrane protease YugP